MKNTKKTIRARMKRGDIPVETLLWIIATIVLGAIIVFIIVKRIMPLGH